ncbi:M48 family metallopeptidase [Novispirillum sp. DQ9]|uniref:M48 family metallopeptidase n=1 Tax=Novispirillum sp. DQ9 TaxID=3398612 RepID=UPI003C7D68A4
MAFGMSRFHGIGAALVVVGGLAGCAGESTGLGLGLVPEEQVQQMGQQAWQKIRSETPATRDAAMQARAERVSNRILAAAGETPRAWDVVVFQGREANAFALPGRHIGVYEGMMRFVRSDAELASVIGHEIAHVTQNHSAERVNTQVATQTGVQIAAAAAGAANMGSPEMIASILGAGAQYGIAMPYGRNQELEADRLGLGYMARAGYNPEAAISLWQRMETGGGPEFLSTHPGADRRIERIRAWLPEVMPVYRANARE